jgi:peptidoglycan/LPS O-acetylase OafA/YrhL
LPSTEHLWFLLYLWAYSMALVAALVLLPERWQARAREGVEMLGTGARLLLVPLALMVLARLSIVFVIPEGGNLLTDWHNHFAYVPPFLFGFALAATPALWRPVARLWRPALAISLACAIVLLWAEATYPNGEMPGHLAEMLILSASAAMGWAMLLVLLAAAQRWLRRDHRLRPIAAEAVFPFYLIHQTIIVVLGWELHPLALGAGIEFAIILAATVAGCAAFYLVGREIAWLRPLIGLSGPPPPPADRHPLPAPAAAP